MASATDAQQEPADGPGDPPASPPAQGEATPLPEATAPVPAAPEQLWRAPPVTTLVVFLFVAGAFLAVGWRDDAGGASTTFVRSVPWVVWKLTAAVAVVLWLALLLVGIARIRRRTALGLRHISGATLAAYSATAVLTAGVVVAFLVLGNQELTFTLAAADVPLRSRLLTAVAAVCAVPWLVLVWLCHREVRALDGPVAALDGELPPSAGTESSGQLLENLVRLWGLVRDCVGAFAVFVVTGLVTSGALRAAFASQHAADAPELDAFPASYVLLYGLFFTLVLSAVALPLVISWRARAMRLVDAMYPPPPVAHVEQDWVDGRARLEAYLGLDVSVLRNPLTALSVFLPLVTAALATFVPDLGG